MKKTIIALMALAGVAMGDTITLDNTFYSNPNTWVYLWNSTDSKWQVSKSATDSSLVDNSAPNGTNPDPVFFGYEFAYNNGVQTMTATGTPLTVVAPTWLSGNKGIHIGTNVSLTGNNNGFRANTMFYFSDISTSLLGYTGGFWKQGNVAVTGSLTLSENTFEHTFFSSTKMEQNSGVWNFSNFVVTDAQGNALTYTTDEEEIGKAGYFWVEESAFTQGAAYSAKLVAKAIPEPTTATLSLLALAGLAARRRRK